MATQTHIRLSLLRASKALERRPSTARQEDSPAVAVWNGGLSTHLLHPSVRQLGTDMPAALGGGAGHPSPGWYYRAGVASCMVTSIAMEAALRQITLTRLEVSAHSESDARGMLGIPGVPSMPHRFRLKVALASPDAPESALRSLVAAAEAASPMAQAVRGALAIEVDVDPRMQDRGA